MKSMFALGIKAKLFSIFTLVCLGMIWGGYQLSTVLAKLEKARAEQSDDMVALNALKDIQGYFADANLLAMDIIVDYMENPKVKVVREGELLEMKNASMEEAKTWKSSLETVGVGEKYVTLQASFDDLLKTNQRLVDAINRGETNPDVYAKFDEDIDGAKEKGVAFIVEMRSALEADFSQSQQLMESSFAQLSKIGVIVFVGCLGALFFVGTPIILSTSKSILRLQQKLADVTKSMHGTSTNLSSASQSLAESSTQAAAAIQESVSAMTEMNSMLAQTTRNAFETSELSTGVMDQAQNGVRVMEEMASSMNAISQSSSRLKEIVTVIENITAKTNVINDVVFKTQLLAVNASIEAARAGHHGKGFSVVANEVASLAALSGKASSEIRELLQTSSTRVTDIIDGTSSLIRDGEKASLRSSDSFTQIVKSVSQIADKVEQITAASREQEAGVSQTSTALTQMNQATTTTNAMAQRNAKLGQELATQASHLKKIDRAMCFIVSGSEETGSTLRKRVRFQSHIDRILEHSTSEAPNTGVNEQRVPSVHSNDLQSDDESTGRMSVLSRFRKKHMNKSGSQSENDSSIGGDIKHKDEDKVA